MIALAALPCLYALAAPAVLPAVDVGEVVAAERAFARAARDRGVGAAFRSFAAADALIFAPGPRPAAPLFAAAPDVGGTLAWWPAYAGIAASGDLGFTTGPFVQEDGPRRRHGNYFTIWRRQADGAWRWVLDHGPTASGPPPAAPSAAVATLPPAPAAAAPAGKAWDSLLAAEAALASALAADAPGALRTALADDARLLREGSQPAVGRSAFAALLAAGPQRIEASHLGGGVSAAGDLAFTYGRAAWGEATAPARGHYLRLWQRRAAGWSLIVDQIIPPPPAARPAAPDSTR